MAVHRLPNFDHYFSCDWVFAVPAIKNVLPETHSDNCGRTFIWLTIQDNLLLLTEGYDKLYKLQPMINVMSFQAISSYETNQKGHQNLGIGLFMLWISV